MQKSFFQNELTQLQPIQRGSVGRPVFKMQEWLSLWNFQAPNSVRAVVNDEDFQSQITDKKDF